MGFDDLRWLSRPIECIFKPCGETIFAAEKYVNTLINCKITFSLKKKIFARFASNEKLVSLQARKSDFGSWITIN